ncbi:hypothetical protein JWG45_15920 [Leptospira sp. 201903070]|uniref:Uncharacterized protein n=1 Tax=Leptospira ainlahdjerensis TaxID=2810033 RepID=A0ABS2UGE8_9LEPT|nr:hypothetical protein [Leptospira ainlahdjerensis]MBM9578633.1 hypothetical protein [Leptospira ainlahdjerensis]
MAILAAISLGFVLFVSAVATAAWLAFSAAGSILSSYAVQGYIAGGFSKSSFNNIHWDEKSARIGGCYGAAVSFWGLQIGVGSYINISIAAAAKDGAVGAKTIISIIKPNSALGPFSALDVVTSQFLVYHAVTSNGRGVASDLGGYSITYASSGQISAPVGLIIDGVEGTQKTCGGSL